MKRFAIAFLVLILAAGCAACGGGDEPAAADSDGDGWTDVWEKEMGSDPFNADTDGDGYQDSLDPDPLDASIPAAAQTPSPTATTASQPSPTATPTPTPGPVWPGPAEPIPGETLQDCYEQFRSDYEEVTTATAYQSTDHKTVFLTFSIHWDVPHARAKPLAEAFVRLVKARVDVPPGATLGPGKYDYVPQANNAGGWMLVQGMKCAECDSITWL